MVNDEIIKRILEGPSVLLVGQKYLSLISNKDILLEKTLKKFQKNEETNSSIIDYNLLYKLNIGSDYDSIASWIDDLSKDISAPVWLERIASIPWSHIYTSAIDSIISRPFLTEWRNIQPVYDDKYKIADYRNKFNLHISYLFGCLSQIEQNKRPPFSYADKIKRKFISNELLRRLPEIITPKGILVIEGYNEEKDWLSFEDLYGIISQLGINQAILCSAQDTFINNDLVKSAIESKKLIVTKNSFAQIISEIESSKNIHISIPEPENHFGKWLTIGEHKVSLPQNLLSRISRTATVVDDSLFHLKTFENEEDRYYDFKSFLASSNTVPVWQGFAKGFAFKRNYYQTLKEKVIEKIQANKNKETPIVLYGQSSSGKTLSLGLLAYEIKEQFKLPILFIEKRYQKIDEADIDAFCKWAEDNNAKNTLLIWDGMVEFELYFKLLRRLNTRGRNVILVGSTYNTNKILVNADGFIETPIELSQEEKKRFLDFIKTIDTLLSNVLSGIDDRNFLAMLYRHLPTSRDRIKRGLKNEFDFFSKLMREKSAEGDSSTLSKGSLYEAMISAGVIENSEIISLNQTTTIDSDVINISDQLIFSIMVPGQFALDVPFELLLRSIGYEVLSSPLFKSLNEVDLITWFEDSQGNILLGPRTAIEATILTNYLGSKRAQVEYIKLLLREVKCSDFAVFGYESNPEVQFAVELLNNIGPNANKEGFLAYLYDVTQVLREIRENGNAYHPRLILKEASFLRELAKNKHIQIDEPRFSLLERAELMVRQALAELEDFQERVISSYLKGELASILGTKATELSDGNHDEGAKECYELVKQINNYAFASNPDNYSALDVLAWTTDNLIRKNVLKGTEKITAEAEMISLFEMAEMEGISEQNKESFYGRKMKFYELIGNEALANNTFNFLNANGYATGYYIRAKKILGISDSLGNLKESELIEKNKEVYEYLYLYFDKIKEDGKCLFLLLKSWWTWKAKAPLFSSEKQSIPLSKKDWEFCLEIIELLLFNEEVYQSATIIYLKAIAQFHIGQFSNSLETFRILDLETDFSSYGRRRIVKSYLASTEDGFPAVYSGEVRYSVSFKRKEKSGELYVPELKNSIPFILNDFNRQSFQQGELINSFYIGFNFRGPIAVPIK